MLDDSGVRLQQVGAFIPNRGFAVREACQTRPPLRTLAKEFALDSFNKAVRPAGELSRLQGRLGLQQEAEHAEEPGHLLATMATIQGLRSVANLV